MLRMFGRTVLLYGTLHCTVPTGDIRFLDLVLTWQIVYLCPSTDDEHDGVQPEAEHEHDDDDVLDGNV